VGEKQWPFDDGQTSTDEEVTDSEQVQLPKPGLRRCARVRCIASVSLSARYRRYFDCLRHDVTPWFEVEGYNACYFERYSRVVSMASPPNPRAERPSTTTLNERLIDATFQLLREEVPADLTVRRIATTAGTTTMALYTGFGSRDGLLDVVYARGFEQLGEYMAPATLLADPEEALVELLRAYRAFALANPGLYGLLFERVLPGFDPSPEVRCTALDTTFGLVTSQAGRLLGLDARDAAAQELAYMLWALTHGLVTLELSHISRSPLPHPALARANGQEVLDTALRVAIAGWNRTSASIDTAH
jgi:AcrR family transcriptional regulator